MNVKSTGRYIILLYSLDITDNKYTCKILCWIVVSMATSMHACVIKNKRQKRVYCTYVSPNMGSMVL